VFILVRDSWALTQILLRWFCVVPAVVDDDEEDDTMCDDSLRPRRYCVKRNSA